MVRAVKKKKSAGKKKAKVVRKKGAKKNPKKKVSKKTTPKKKSGKKTTKKKAAKRKTPPRKETTAPKKAPRAVAPPKRAKPTPPPPGAIKEEAVRRYREGRRLYNFTGPEEGPVGDDAMESLDEESSVDGPMGRPEDFSSGPKLVEEYNMDDEFEDDNGEDYVYGLGHNDAFDRPEEVEKEDDEEDEDERYTRGLDTKEGDG